MSPEQGGWKNADIGWQRGELGLENGPPTKFLSDIICEAKNNVKLGYKLLDFT